MTRFGRRKSFGIASSLTSSAWSFKTATFLLMCLAVCVATLLAFSQERLWISLLHNPSESFDPIVWPHRPAYVPTSKPSDKAYRPASAETYILQHSQRLGYDTSHGQSAAGCTIWNDPSESTIYKSLHAWKKEVRDYAARVQNFTSAVPDVRRIVEDDPTVCDTLQLHPDGWSGLFPSGQLSETTRMGMVEPLFAPMRHPGICEDPTNKDQPRMLSLDYMVHDFAAICRTLTRTSRTVLIDMGASLDFHGHHASPAVYLTNMYHRFGMPFDHIYSYEVKPTVPDKVFRLVPNALQAAYHWINVPVDPDPDSPRNPFRMLLENFEPNDFVVVKLDIDTPSVEWPLVQQLLHDETLQTLVDQFYFEHHVHLLELNRSWKRRGMGGSVQDSLQLFHALRSRGVAAHFWV
jgi:hypothetical protein